MAFLSRARLPLLAVVLLLACVAARTAGAQAPRVVRLGLLSPGASFADDSPLLAAFREGLAERGWIEGKNLELVRRYSGGDRSLFVGSALVSLGVDLIVAASTYGAMIARDATPTLPIVFVGVSDPVGSGIVPSLGPARGGNVTGVSDFDTRSSVSSLELLKQVAPTISRVALIANPGAPMAGRQIAEIEAAAPGLGITVHLRRVTDPTELADALRALIGNRDQAMVVLPDPLFNAMRESLVGFAARHRLPAIYGYSSFISAGGLMSYGTDVPDLYRRAAGLVDRILNGAAPGDLPVEGPVKFHLAINLGTAQRLALTVPETLRRQADQLVAPGQR